MTDSRSPRRVVVIAGVALEIGIAPTVRHAADLGFIPVVLTDACGCGNAEAAQRSLDAMRFTGDAVLTDIASFIAAVSQPASPTAGTA